MEGCRCVCGRVGRCAVGRSVLVVDAASPWWTKMMQAGLGGDGLQRVAAVGPGRNCRWSR